MGDWFQRLGDRFVTFAVRQAQWQSDPESMIAAFIMVGWTVLAGLWGGWPVVLFMVIITGTLHAMAVTSGSHVVLWLSTSALLVMIAVASQTLFGGLPPVLLAAGGATALAHNELIRLNYTRRRNAVVHDAIFQASGLALAAAAAVGVAGVAFAQAASSGSDRSWLWMPAGVAVLLLIGFGLSIGPARRAKETNTERWQPGDRIPPQPLGREDLEQF